MRNKLDMAKKIISNKLVSYLLTVGLLLIVFNLAQTAYTAYDNGRVYRTPLDQFVQIESVQVENINLKSIEQFGMTIRSVKRGFITDVYHEPVCYDPKRGEFVQVGKAGDHPLILVDRGRPLEAHLNPDGTENKRVSWTIPISDQLKAELAEGDRCGWQITYFFHMPDGTLKEYPKSFLAEYTVEPDDVIEAQYDETNKTLKLDVKTEKEVDAVDVQVQTEAGKTPQSTTQPAPTRQEGAIEQSTTTPSN